MCSISSAFYKRICANILELIKVQTSNVRTRKLCTKLMYEKATCKMTLKLTPGVNFINILRAAFSFKSFAQSFFVLAVKVKLFIGARILAQNVGEIDT
jgi:hypothetical protein